jgi:hypothetical protein
MNGESRGERGREREEQKKRTSKQTRKVPKIVMDDHKTGIVKNILPFLFRLGLPRMKDVHSFRSIL